MSLSRKVRRKKSNASSVQPSQAATIVRFCSPVRFIAPSLGRRRFVAAPSHFRHLNRQQRGTPSSLPRSGGRSTAARRDSKSAFWAIRPGEIGRLRMIIAIDGPAASGKGTIARRLAAHYRLPHLDTGLLYRATAAALIAADRDIYDEPAAIAAARGLGPYRLRRDRPCAAARWGRRPRSSPPCLACGRR